MQWFHLSQNNGSVCLHSEYPNWTVDIILFIYLFAYLFIYLLIYLFFIGEELKRMNPTNP